MQQHRFGIFTVVILSLAGEVLSPLHLISVPVTVVIMALYIVALIGLVARRNYARRLIIGLAVLLLFNAGDDLAKLNSLHQQVHTAYLTSLNGIAGLARPKGQTSEEWAQRVESADGVLRTSRNAVDRVLEIGATRSSAALVAELGIVAYLEQPVIRATFLRARGFRQRLR